MCKKIYKHLIEYIKSIFNIPYGWQDKNGYHNGIPPIDTEE